MKNFAEHEATFRFCLATPDVEPKERDEFHSERRLAESLSEALRAALHAWARERGAMAAGIELEVLYSWSDRNGTFRIA
jgi:hypothetical protein